MVRKRPILLGIVGDSAAGKTTLMRGLAEVLGPERVTLVSADDYHRYDRTERAERNITPLHPDCNFLDILELQLERLHYGQPILKPVYDHSNGTLARPEYLQPKEFVIVEGLLGFHTAVMRQFYDVKVYLDPPGELRTMWKIRRDTAKRGYSREQVLAELERREADSQAFIRPQREHADIVVRFRPSGGLGPEEVESHLESELVLRPTIPHPDLSYLVDDDGTGDCGIRLALDRDGGRPADFLTIEGTVTRAQATRLAAAIWRHLPSLRRVETEDLGRYHDPNGPGHSDPLALTQLLLTYHLLRAHCEGGPILFAPPVAALSRVGRGELLANQPPTEQPSAE